MEEIKRILVALHLLAIACLLFGCSTEESIGNEKEEGKVEKVTAITFSSSKDQKPEFGGNGGERTIEFTAPSSWTAIVSDPSASWLSISPTSGAAGKVQMKMTVDKNGTYDPRSTAVIIQAGNERKDIYVTQAQQNALILTKTDYDANGDGDTITVEIQSNMEYTYSVNSDWIKELPKTRGLTTSYVTFVVQLNKEETRKCEIKFKGAEKEEKITISQVESPIWKRQTEIMHELYYALNLNPEDYGFISGGLKWDINDPIDKWSNVKIEDGHITSIRCPRYIGYHREGHLLEGRIHHIGYIPKSIGELTELKSFIINDHNLALKKTIPNEIGNLSKLEELMISACNIPGNIPDGICNLANLKELILKSIPSQINFSGEYIKLEPFSRTMIPENIGQLEKLEKLSISWLINGGVPSSINNLKKLKDLGIEEPSSIVDPGGYSSTHIPQQAIGTIPDDLNQMVELETLVLGVGVTGVFPTSINNLKKLRSIVIDSDFLEGSLPESIGELQSLEKLQISCSKMSGNLPESLGNLTNLKSLWIRDSGFGGPIPSSLENCKNITSFYLSNCYFTSIPGSLSVLLDRKANSDWINRNGIFRIEGNCFTGPIPEEFVKHPNFYLFAGNFLLKQRNGYGFDLTNFKYPACPEIFDEIFTGKKIDFKNVYVNNKYTLIYRYNDYYNENKTLEYSKLILSIYEKYGSLFNVFCGFIDNYSDDSKIIRSYAQSLGLDIFPHFRDIMGYTDNDCTPFFNDSNIGNCQRNVPTIGLVDMNGNYLFVSGVNSRQYDSNFSTKYIIDADQIENIIKDLWNASLGR